MDSFKGADVLLRYRDGKVVAGIPQLAIYAKADTVQGALDLLKQKKAEFDADLADAGEFDDIRVRSGLINTGEPPNSKRTPELLQYATKAVIMMAALGVALTFSGFLVISKAQSTIKASKISSSELLQIVAHRVDRAADPDNDLPEEAKKKLLADIRILADRWRPFANEVMEILSDRGSAPTQPSQAKP
jgi:hypothetical protein